MKIRYVCVQAWERVGKRNKEKKEMRRNYKKKSCLTNNVIVYKNKPATVCQKSHNIIKKHAELHSSWNVLTNFLSTHDFFFFFPSFSKEIFTKFAFFLILVHKYRNRIIPSANHLVFSTFIFKFPTAPRKRNHRCRVFICTSTCIPVPVTCVSSPK